MRCVALRRSQRDQRPAAGLQHTRGAHPGLHAAGQRPTRAHHSLTAPGRQPQQETMTSLRAVGLAKSYQSRQVVRDLSIEVANGEVVGLLGPNGAGKTTAFYMIVGLVQCDAGSIQLGDTDLTLLPMHRRAQLGLGYLPQEASIFRKLSVENNVLAILEARSDLDRAARERRLEELLEELRIGHVRRSLG